MKIQFDNFKTETRNNKNVSISENKNFSNRNQISEINNPFFGIDAVNQSQINASIPVTYQKIGEMTVPNLDNKVCFYLLSNGQKVAIAPKKGHTRIETKFNVGALNERNNQFGMSHCIEHNLYAGSRELKPNEYEKRIEALGASANAATSWKSTKYHADFQLVEDNSLEENIGLNANLTQFPLFAQDYLENEKGAILSEIDSILDDEAKQATISCFRNLFNLDIQQAGIAGSKEAVSSFTRDDLLDYYNTWYTPDNSSTCIVGDVGYDETMGFVSKNFNKKNDYSKISKRFYPVIKPTNKMVRQDFNSKQSYDNMMNLSMALPSNIPMRDIVILEFIAEFLNDSDNYFKDELDKFSKVNYFYCKKKVANSPNSPGAFSVISKTEEKDSESNLKRILSKLNELKTVELCPIELEKYKKQYLKQYLSNLSSDTEILIEEIQEAFDFNDCNYVQNKISILQNITTKDIMEIASKYFNFNQSSIVMNHAKTANQKEIQKNYKNANEPNNVFFTSKYKAQDLVKQNLENSDIKILPNNIEFSTHEGQKNDSNFFLALDFPYLEDVSAIELEVLESILEKGSLKEEDSDSKDLDALISIVQPSGIVFMYDFEDDEDMKKKIEQLRNTLSCPNFSQEWFEGVVSSLKDKLDQREEEISDLIDKKVYPDIKAHSLSIEEQKKILDNLTIEDVKKIYYRILSSSCVQAGLCGDLEGKPQEKTYLESFLRTLPVFKPVNVVSKQKKSRYKPIEKQEIITKERDTKKADVVMAYTFEPSNEINEIARMDVLNRILGEGANSRLFEDLRNTQGLVYDAHSDLENTRTMGLIKLVTDVTSDNDDTNIKKVTESFKRNVELLKTQDVADEELKIAKNTLKTELLNDFETNMLKNAKMVVNGTSYYGKEYYLKYYEALNKVTKEDIKTAANHMFKDKPIIAVEANKGTLEKLNSAN